MNEPKKTYDAVQYRDTFGEYPENDDLHRVNCEEAGTLGHWFCGVCAECNLPRFRCPCMVKPIR